MLVHCLLYVPTISISNSIAFANMKDPQKEFGLVRMGGTIGWILAAWPFTFILVDWAAVEQAEPAGVRGLARHGARLGADRRRRSRRRTRWTFIVAGIASLVLAAFSLTLAAHAAASKAGEGAVEKLAWLEAMKLLKHPFVLVLWLVTFVDASCTTATSTGPARSWAPAWRRAAWAFPATGSCR